MVVHWYRCVGLILGDQEVLGKIAIKTFSSYCYFLFLRVIVIVISYREPSGRRCFSFLHP